MTKHTANLYEMQYNTYFFQFQPVGDIFSDLKYWKQTNIYRAFNELKFYQTYLNPNFTSEQKNSLFEILHDVVIEICKRPYYPYDAQRTIQLFLEYVHYYLNDISNEHIYDVFNKFLNNQISMNLKDVKFKSIRDDITVGPACFLAEIFYDMKFPPLFWQNQNTNTLSMIDYIQCELFKYYKIEAKKEISRYYISQLEDISAISEKMPSFCLMMEKYSEKYREHFIQLQKTNFFNILQNHDFDSILKNFSEMNQSNDILDEELAMYTEKISEIIKLYSINLESFENQLSREKTMSELINIASSKNMLNLDQIKEGLLENNKSLKLFEKLFYDMSYDEFLDFFSNMPRFSPSISVSFLNILENIEIDSELTDLQELFNKVVDNMDYNVSNILFEMASNPQFRDIIRNTIINSIRNYDEESMNILFIFLACNLYEPLNISPEEADIEDLIYEILPSYSILSSLASLGNNYKILHQKKLVRSVPPSTQLFNYLKNHSTDFDEIMDWILAQNSQSRQFYDLLLAVCKTQKEENLDLIWKIFPLAILMEEDEKMFIIPIIDCMEVNPNIIIQKMKSDNSNMIEKRLFLFDLSQVDTEIIYKQLKESPQLLILAHQCPTKISLDFDAISLQDVDIIERSFILDAAVENADENFWTNIYSIFDQILPDFSDEKLKDSNISGVVCEIFMRCYEKFGENADENFLDKAFSIGIKNNQTDLFQMVINQLEITEDIIKAAFSHNEEYFANILIDRLENEEDFKLALKYSSPKGIETLLNYNETYLSDHDWISKLPDIDDEEIIKNIIDKIEQNEENYQQIFTQLYSTSYNRTTRRKAARIIFDALPDANYLVNYLKNYKFRENLSVNSDYLSVLYVLSAFPFVLNSLDSSNDILKLAVAPSAYISYKFISGEYEELMSKSISSLPNHLAYKFGQEIALDSLTCNRRDFSKESLLFLEIKFNESIEKSIAMTHQTYRTKIEYSKETSEYNQSGISAKYISAPNVIAYKITNAPGELNVPFTIVNHYCSEFTEYSLSSFVAQNEDRTYITYIQYDNDLLRITPTSYTLEKATLQNDIVKYVFYLKHELSLEKITAQSENSKDLTCSSIILSLYDGSIDYTKIQKLPGADKLGFLLLAKFKYPNLFDQIIAESNNISDEIVGLMEDLDVNFSSINLLIKEDRILKMNLSEKQMILLLNQFKPNANKELQLKIIQKASQHENAKFIFEETLRNDKNFWLFAMMADLTDNIIELLKTTSISDINYQQINDQISKSNVFWSNFTKVFDKEELDGPKKEFVSNLIMRFIKFDSDSYIPSIVKLIKNYHEFITDKEFVSESICQRIFYTAKPVSTARKLLEIIEYLPVPFDKIKESTKFYTNIKDPDRLLVAGTALFKYMQVDPKAFNYSNIKIFSHLQNYYSDNYYYDYNEIIQVSTKFFDSLTPEKLKSMDHFEKLFSSQNVTVGCLYSRGFLRLFNKDWVKNSNLLEYYAFLVYFDIQFEEVSIEAMQLLVDNGNHFQYHFNFKNLVSTHTNNLIYLFNRAIELNEVLFNGEDQCLKYLALFAEYKMKDKVLVEHAMDNFDLNMKFVTIQSSKYISRFFIKLRDYWISQNISINLILTHVFKLLKYFYECTPRKFIDNYFYYLEILSDDGVCNEISKKNWNYIQQLNIDMIGGISPTCPIHAIEKFGEFKLKCYDYFPMCFKTSSFLNILERSHEYKEDAIMKLLDYFQLEIISSEKEISRIQLSDNIRNKINLFYTIKSIK